MTTNANFPTWDSDHYGGGTSSAITFTFGSCRVNTSSASGYPLIASNIAFPITGKWYIELCNIVSNGYHCFGIINEKQFRYGNKLLDGTGAYQYQAWNGQVRGNGGSSTAYGATWQAVGDVIGLAFDTDTGKIYWSKNGTFQNSGDPANGTNPAFTVPTDTQYYFGWSDYYTGAEGTVHINCGQDSSFGAQKTSGSANATDGNGIGNFYYTPPTGFLSLGSASLPLAAAIDPAETDSDYVGEKQFNTIQYTGNGSTQSITGLGFKPDLILMKDTTGAGATMWADSTRGTTKILQSNANAADYSAGTNYVTSFDTDGFSLGGSTDVNENAQTFTAMAWKANGGTTSSNSNGGITSTVQANQDIGFSIISYTASGSNSSIGHGLSQKPDFHIIKKLNGSGNWTVYHKDLGATKYLRFNALDGASTFQYNYNNTEPDATKIYLGDNGNTNHPNGDTYICYAWHQVEGFSKFGMYAGSGSTTGSYIHCGFRPAMVWIKKSSESSTTYGWPAFVDIIQGNVNTDYFKNFWIDQSVAASNSYPLDFLAKGFRHRNNNTNLDAVNQEYVYFAFADQPGKYSNAF